MDARELGHEESKGFWCWMPKDTFSIPLPLSAGGLADISNSGLYLQYNVYNEVNEVCTHFGYTSLAYDVKLGSSGYENLVVDPNSSQTRSTSSIHRRKFVSATS